MPDEKLKNHLADKNSLDITSVKAVSGGSINRAEKLTTNRGTLFLKWNDTQPAEMFSAEAHGLRLLREAKTSLRIPGVIDLNSEEGELPGYLLMEYIEGVRGDGESSRLLGTGLAELHSVTSDAYGLDRDNFIGSLPQSNRKHTDWVSFFIEERINPQLKMAIDGNRMNRNVMKGWNQLAAKLEEIFPESQPVLIHGDLWGGNYFFDSNGRPVLIDPAVYFGHHEMEIAFTKMFGGFSSEFYDTYAFEMNIASGFSQRVEIYNLYPLLVHANLFGGHYARQASSFLKQYAG